LVERLGPKDLIAQQYINSVLAGPLDRAFSSASMAFRRGISRVDATNRVRELIATGHRYAVRTDVADFFPSVDHGRLLAVLDQLLPRGDVKLRRILAGLVGAPFVRDGVLQDRRLGLAQGSPLSPLLANVYLDAFDRRLSASGLAFVRYADDVVILTRSAADSRSALTEVEAALDALGLGISPEKTRLASASQGFEFLGERFGNEEGAVVQALLPRRKPLIITEPHLLLAVNGPALDLRRNGKLIATLPLREISEIVILARATFSTALIERCAHFRIPVSIALSSGYQIGTFTPASRAYHEVAWTQGDRYRALTVRDRTAIAGQLAGAKIMNFIPLIRARYVEGDGALVRDLELCADQAQGALTNDQIRGHEGHAARLVYAWLNRQIVDSKQRWFRSARRDRVAPDRLNSMLNFGYYLLFTRINGLVRACGLNPYLGFLHESTEDFETLVCDIQEPFRAHVDRLVLRLINRGEIRAADFDQEKKGFRLTREGIGRFVAGYEMLFSEVHNGITVRDAIVLQVENIRDFLVQGKSLKIYRWNVANKNCETAQNE